MPDVYITITEAAPALLEGLMTALECRRGRGWTGAALCQ